MYIWGLKPDVYQPKYIDLVVNKELALGAVELSNFIGNSAADVCRLRQGVRRRRLRDPLQTFIILQKNAAVTIAEYRCRRGLGEALVHTLVSSQHVVSVELYRLC